MSSTIGEPFQLFLSSALSKKAGKHDAVFCSYNPNFPGYATVTAQGDGIHVWDLRDLHAVASYSVGEHVAFAAAAFTLPVTEDGNRSVISYAILGHAPGTEKNHRRHTIWAIRQSLSGSTVAASEKTEVVIDHALIKICGTGHATMPLLLISENATLFLADAQVDIKSYLDWPGEREHFETFVFPCESCNFIQGDIALCGRVAVTFCQTSTTLHVRLVLLGEEIVPLGTCEISIASSASDADVVILGLTCSPSGTLSFIDSRGIWVIYQLVFLNSSLAATPVSENLHLKRFSVLTSKRPSAGDSLSVVSLGTSLVLLAALVEETQAISLQIWDLSYGVLLTTESMTVSPGIISMHMSLTVAEEGQVLLIMSSPQYKDKKGDPGRSSIHIVPVDARLRSRLAFALRKTALTSQWSIPNATGGGGAQEGDESAKMVSSLEKSLRNNDVQRAEQAFLKWVNSRSSKEATLGYEFVKKIFNLVLPQQSSAYAPRITHYLLENAVVSTIMLNGCLVTALRQRGDWENVMLALTKVTDISEDELMAAAKSLVDRQSKSGNAMEVDTLGGYVPPLWMYLSACVSYPFSVVPMRLAIRKHLSDAQDLVLILEILEQWIQGGTEHETETLLMSVAKNTKIASSGANSPPYPKVIMFLQALLDASFVALLQYQPSYDLLRRMLSYIEPEIILMENLEPLRGLLQPFAKAQRLKERMSTSKESPTEWKKRRKQLEQRDGLNVGLYRLEELVL